MSEAQNKNNSNDKKMKDMKNMRDMKEKFHTRATKFIETLIHKNGEYDSTRKFSNDYFENAKSWADEFYVAAIASRNKWRALALFVFMPIVFLLLISVNFLIPSQHIEPLIINHYSDGQTIVVPMKQHYLPQNSAEVESDLAKYVKFRQSYSPDTYDYSYRLIHLMSSGHAFESYQSEQSISNKNSPINSIGKNGYQSVKIQSIVFLDNVNKNIKNKNADNADADQSKKRYNMHNNLAQVDFVVNSFDAQNNTTSSKAYTALIGWTYRGTPENPSERWMDWNGFTVTHYEVSDRNI